MNQKICFNNNISEEELGLFSMTQCNEGHSIKEGRVYSVLIAM